MLQTALLMRCPSIIHLGMRACVSPTGRKAVGSIAGIPARAESFPLLKATFVPGQTLNENHAYKRCASHVYIARFIEYQTNKNRSETTP